MNPYHICYYELRNLDGEYFHLRSHYYILLQKFFTISTDNVIISNILFKSYFISSIFVILNMRFKFSSCIYILLKLQNDILDFKNSVLFLN